jgi:hypothetical protein
MGDKRDRSRLKYLRELENCLWISYQMVFECTSKGMKKYIFFLYRYYYEKIFLIQSQFTESLETIIGKLKSCIKGCGTQKCVHNTI